MGTDSIVRKTASKTTPKENENPIISSRREVKRAAPEKRAFLVSRVTPVPRFPVSPSMKIMAGVVFLKNRRSGHLLDWQYIVRFQ